MTIAQEFINRFSEPGVIFDIIEEQLIDMSIDAKHLGDGVVYLFDDNSIIRATPTNTDYKYYI